MENTVAEKNNFTYIVECENGSFYTGWTNDLLKRMLAHKSGTGAKYTHAKKVVQLLYFERFEDKKQAMRREWEIKQLTRKQKERLLLTPLESEDQALLKKCNDEMKSIS